MTVPSGAGRRVRTSGCAAGTEGAELAFQLDGPEGAPPLLLMQGQSNSSRWWRRLRADFADQWLTITFDYRGTGETLAPLVDGPAWSTAGFAEDAAAVLAAAGVARASVYGTSMGGRIAQQLALAEPELVDRLVLACSSPGGSTAVERSQQVRRRLADPDPDRRRRALIDLFYTRHFVDAAGGYDHVPDDLLGDPASPAAGALQLKVSHRHDAGLRLAQIEAPTLVLHGTEDRLTPPVNAETIADLIPGSVLKLYDGGRHGFFDESRDVVVPSVREFLTA